MRQRGDGHFHNHRMVGACAMMDVLVDHVMESADAEVLVPPENTAAARVRAPLPRNRHLLLTRPGRLPRAPPMSTEDSKMVFGVEQSMPKTRCPIRTVRVKTCDAGPLPTVSPLNFRR